MFTLPYTWILVDIFEELIQTLQNHIIGRYNVNHEIFWNCLHLKIKNGNDRVQCGVTNFRCMAEYAQNLFPVVERRHDLI